jgi:hypothetical protein
LPFFSGLWLFREDEEADDVVVVVVADVALDFDFGSDSGEALFDKEMNDNLRVTLQQRSDVWTSLVALLSLCH